MKYEDTIITKKEIEEKGYTIENDIIKNIDIEILGHFGNVCSMNIYSSCCILLSGYNNTGNLGYMIKSFVELLDLTEEDGIRFKDIHKIPCRLIIDGNRCIGFGHFMKDKFIMTEDFVKINGI